MRKEKRRKAVWEARARDMCKGEGKEAVRDETSIGFERAVMPAIKSYFPKAKPILFIDSRIPRFNVEHFFEGE